MNKWDLVYQEVGREVINKYAFSKMLLDIMTNEIL